MVIVQRVVEAEAEVEVEVEARWRERTRGRRRVMEKNEVMTKKKEPKKPELLFISALVHLALG